MKRISSIRFLMVLASAVLFVITIELGSFAYFSFSNIDIKTARDYYLRIKSLGEDSGYVVTPVFSYVINTSQANNFGFYSKYDYPYRRKENDFIIGVFGGSVADQLAQGTMYLGIDSIFKEKFSKLKDKNVVFLNFAVAGGKQPMQFQRFSYFARDLDLAINLDGFNEVEFNERGSLIEFPSSVGWVYDKAYATGSFRVRASILDVVKSARNKVVNTFLFSYSNGLLLFVKVLDSLVGNLSTKLREKEYGVAHAAKSKLHPLEGEETRDLYSLGAKSWAYYSRLQLAVAKELKVHALIVLQPNRLDKNSKPLSEEEMNMDDNLAHHGARWSLETEGVSRGYGELRQQLAEMKKKAPHNFLDLSLVFKNHPESLYIDSCCHLSETAAKLIWTEIAKNATLN